MTILALYGLGIIGFLFWALKDATKNNGRDPATGKYKKVK